MSAWDKRLLNTALPLLLSDGKVDLAQMPCANQSIEF
jgi:hypothetical protein